MEAYNPSIYIRDVVSSYKNKDVWDVISAFNYGEIRDIVSTRVKSKKFGNVSLRVRGYIVHFHHWYNNDISQQVLNQLYQGQTIKVLYDDENHYWLFNTFNEVRHKLFSVRAGKENYVRKVSKAKKGRKDKKRNKKASVSSKDGE
jgi:hypothetical protein